MPSEIGYEKVAMNSAAALAEIMGFSPDRIDDLRTAVGEACLNAVEHGNRCLANIKVLVTLRTQDGELCVAIQDRGSHAIIAQSRPSLDEKIRGNDRARGWGMFLIENLVDEMWYEHGSTGGNTVYLLFRLDAADLPDLDSERPSSEDQ